jgi:hypothetical protein
MTIGSTIEAVVILRRIEHPQYDAVRRLRSMVSKVERALAVLPYEQRRALHEI